MDERGAMDFIHEQFRNGRRFRILNRVDDYSRICIGQIIALSISGLCIANYLSQLIQFRQVKPKSIVCDNRAEFTSKAMFYMFYWSRAQLDCIPSGKRTQNAYIGSCYGKSQDSCLNQYWLYPLTNAKTTIENWFIDYNRVRLHRSLGYQPLSVFVQKLASKIVQKRKEVKINNNVI
ncbi:MAG: transposase [Chromatiales bacterium]|nr:transposase [Chromatiales bacterium]